ncbi:Zinc metalloproteinase-disintegrin-like lachestatin-2 [Hondaea fermentalgiana]|uniref:Zinc metalloproteinase-disintegrin-like lachestatin-2 n=1 Tax=Hondaea fermentalgiana TaxID=2315210 RepID=A0A2R5G562_9STRA|nr:Zinc metalloproteinase-disintegrin-like lachestatin-2 [Hondaea fermentalgiana]|eukprot:GBG25685.1 Zinc metalloproteinase-disintegrin-like lachestatin-2 [Hondaea fermentalgiana]
MVKQVILGAVLLAACGSCTTVAALEQQQQQQRVHLQAWTPLEENEVPQDEHVSNRALLEIAEIGDYVQIHTNEVFEHLASMRNNTSTLSFAMPGQANTTLLCNLTESNLAMPPTLAAKFPTLHVWRGKCDDGSLVDLAGEEGAPDSISISFQQPMSAESIYVDSAVPSSSKYLVYNTRKARVASKHAGAGSSRYKYAEAPVPNDADLKARLSATKASAKSASRDEVNASTSSKQRAFASSTQSPTVGRKLRLALIAHKEYVAVSGSTKEAALLAMLKIIYRVNNVYMRELGVYFQLIDNNDELICLPDSTDDACDLSNDIYILYETYDFLEARGVTVDQYDIGHSFTTASGGVAAFESACTYWKEMGTTGLQDPTGDIFAIDFVSHELGHQVGMGHTFRDCQYSNSQLDRRDAVEPGSGTTIMSYAGLCYSTDVEFTAMPIFHPISIQRARAFLEKESCGTVISTSRSSPIVSAPRTCRVPAKQGFFLEGSTTSTDGNSVFQWRALYDEDGTIESFEDALIGDYAFAETRVRFLKIRPLQIVSSGSFAQGQSYTFRWKVGNTKRLAKNVGIYLALDEISQEVIEDFDYGDDLQDPNWVLVATSRNRGRATALVPATIHSSDTAQPGLLMIRSIDTSGCAFFDIKRIMIDP